MEYHNFSTQEFILDERFQAWVLAPDTDSQAFWANWQQQHPEKQLIINQAQAAVRELYLVGFHKEQTVIQPAMAEQPKASTSEMEAIWENIATTIRVSPADSDKDVLPPSGKVISFFSFNNWAKIAASVTVLLAVGYLFWLNQTPATKPAVTVYATRFGETKQITLPDNSAVFLNANSRLTVPQSWSAAKDREITLAGEAFFRVVHTQNHQKFKVNLMKGAQVEVLGTEFTVTNRPDLARVVLNQGQVKVDVMSLAETPAATIMAPGDLVQIDRLNSKLIKQKVADPAKYAAFTKDLLEFNDAPLSEVARVLHDNYGYKVAFVPPSLATKRITSSGPSNRVDLLLFVIEKTFNLKVIQKGKHITLQAK